jgi:hypothetical protein
MLRCQGNRILGAGLQDSYWLHLTQIFDLNIQTSTGLLNSFTAESGPLGPYQCPNHKDGHTIDGGRVRDAIYRLSPSGKPRSRGKVPSIDIKAVEIRFST